MTIYEKNMQAIREHHVRLHEYLETAQPEQSVEIRYEAAEDEMLSDCDKGRIGIPVK